MFGFLLVAYLLGTWQMAGKGTCLREPFYHEQFVLASQVEDEVVAMGGVNYSARVCSVGIDGGDVVRDRVGS